MNAAQGGAYRFVDKSAFPGQTLTYRLEELERDGKTRKYGPFKISAGSGKNLQQPVLNGQGYQMKSHEPSRNKKERIEAANKNRKNTKNWKKSLSSQRAKIFVKQSGIHFLDIETIANLFGLSEKQAEKLLRSKKLALTNRGESSAMYIEDDYSGIYFYGKSNDSIYTDNNVYFLRPEKGDMVEKIRGKSPKPDGLTRTFRETIHAEEDKFVFNTPDINNETDFRMWEYLISSYSFYRKKTFPISSFGVDPYGTSAILSINLKGEYINPSDGNYLVSVSVNGIEIGLEKWKNNNIHSASFVFDPNLLIDGNNEIEVSAIEQTGVSMTYILIDSIDLEYDRFYRAKNDVLRFSSENHTLIHVDGFSQPDIRVFEVSDPLKPKLIEVANVEESFIGFAVTFEPKTNHYNYVAFTKDSAITGFDAWADEPSNLKNPDNFADYIVIAPNELIEGAHYLAEYRNSAGFSSMVVNLEDIYDEFNHGIPNLNAIRDFIEYAYYNWQYMPRYIVLAGDGSYDYKGASNYGDNLFPVKLMSNESGILASDGWFADIEGNDGIPEIAIGRIPVVTEEELFEYTDKLVSYENTYGDWKNRVLMTTDDEDNGEDFIADSRRLEKYIPDGIPTDRIYLDQSNPAFARNAIVSAFNSGIGLINFIGHGGSRQWAAEGILRTYDASRLDNYGAYPVLTSFTCATGFFFLPGYDSLAESLLIQNETGIIAAFASSATSEKSQGALLGESFFKEYFNHNNVTLGDIVVFAKKRFAQLGGNSDHLRLYNLLGDPALLVR